MIGRSPPNYLWPQDRQRTHHPFGRTAEDLKREKDLEMTVDQRTRPQRELNRHAHATSFVWELLDDKRERTVRALRSGYVDEDRSAWVRSASDNIREHASSIAGDVIRGKVACDDADRESLAEWLVDEAEHLAEAWLTARKITV